MARSTTAMGIGPLRSFSHTSNSIQSSVTAPHSLRADVPSSNVGEPIPYVIGRRRVSQPNIIGYGNLQALYQTTTKTETRTYRVPGKYVGPIWEPAYDVEETITTETTVPVGFKADIIVGICLGPGVVLRAIYAGTEALWTGSLGPNRGTLTLGENDTAFSGCEIAFNGGAFDQPVDPWLTDPDLPAYVGVCYIIIRGVRVDISLDPLSFEVERFPNPLGLTSGQNRKDDDINCASAMVDVITNSWGGAGVPLLDIDTEGTFRTAALVYAAEANYCSVLVDNETVATAVLGALQSQTYSVVYQNPGTGKIEVKAIRDLPVPGTVKNFGSQNTIQLRGFNKGAWADTFEVLRGVYANRANHYEPTPIMVQNIGSLSITGRSKRTTEVPYPYVTKDDLTLFLASRDLAYMSVPRFTATLLVNRDGAECLPGDVVRVTEPDYGFWGVPVVVEKVRKGSLKENNVLLTVSEYSLPNTSPIFDVPSQPFDPGISYSPEAPLGVTGLTSPYWVAAKLGRVTPDTSQNVVYPLLFPVPANDLQMYYDVHINNVPGIGQSLSQEGGVYTTYGRLSGAISRWDGLNDGQLATLVVDSVVNPVNLKSYTNNDQRAGRPLVFIGNEIFTFSTATLVGPGQWELGNVKRGLIDTVPLDHALGADVFIVDGAGKNLVPVAFSYPLSYTPQWRLVSATINEKGRYADALAYSGWNSANTPRTLRPVRPHDVRVEGVRSSSPQSITIGEDYSVSWRTRARTSLVIPFQDDPAEPSEGTGGTDVVFHRVYLRDSENILRLLGSTAPDGNYNSLSVTIPSEASLGAGTLFVRSVNQYGESLFDDTLPVEVWDGSSRVIRYQIEA